MIKYLKLVMVVLIVVSCNSSDKKDKDVINKPTNVASNSTSKNKVAVETEKEPEIQNQETLKAQSIERGKSVYNDMCITCHMPDGKGVLRAFPPVADSDYLRDNQNKSIIGIKKGMSGEMVVNGVTYNSVMSPLGLSDKEVADVMNYINNSWGNEIDNYVTPEKVSKL